MCFSCTSSTVPDPQCNSTLEALANTDHYCGLTFGTSRTSPFRYCLQHPDIVGANFAVNCVYDLCALGGDGGAMKEAACGTMQALAAECATSGIVVSWREAAHCRKCFGY